MGVSNALTREPLRMELTKESVALSTGGAPKTPATAIATGAKAKRALPNGMMRGEGKGKERDVGKRERRRGWEKSEISYSKLLCFKKVLIGILSRSCPGNLHDPGCLNSSHVSIFHPTRFEDREPCFSDDCCTGK